MSEKDTPSSRPSESAEQIAAAEKEFFDKAWEPFADWSPAVNPVWFEKYAKPHDMTDWRQKSAKLLGDLKGKRVLDYGCGIGEEAVYFALLGATVDATEVSETALRLAKKRAVYNKVDHQVTFHLVHGLTLDFPDDHFDAIHGFGVLHHVGLEALAEIKRVLKPGGIAVFAEHMGSSRYFVPFLRRLLHAHDASHVESPHETPLHIRAVRRSGALFRECQVYPYHLTYRLRKFLPAAWQPSLLRLDYGLLRALPFLDLYTGGAVIYYRK